MAKLRDLLNFRSLKKLQLITSADGLDTNVGTVTVMEVPDVIQWLRGEDFLITSLYSIGDDEERQCQLIRDLIGSQSSCLAIKTGKYARNISEKMIEIANEHRFPLLHIPYEITYIDLIMDGMNVLMTESNRREIMSKYISEVIFSSSANERMLIEEGRLLKIDLEHDYFQVIVMNTDMEHVVEGTLSRTMKYAMESVLEFTERLSETVSGGYYRLEKGALFLLYSKEPSAIHQYLPFVLSEMKQQFNHLLAYANWKVGIGTSQTRVEGIRRSYLQGVQAIELGRILKKEEMIYTFESQELYANLQDMLLRRKGSLFGDALGCLKNPELVDTLMLYYECDGNLDEIARRMYTHKNTIKYRLNKIKELTGMDVKCQEDNFKLYFMMLEKKLCAR